MKNQLVNLTDIVESLDDYIVEMKKREELSGREIYFSGSVDSLILFRSVLIEEFSK